MDGRASQKSQKAKSDLLSPKRPKPPQRLLVDHILVQMLETQRRGRNLERKSEPFMHYYAQKRALTRTVLSRPFFRTLTGESTPQLCPYFSVTNLQGRHTIFGRASDDTPAHLSYDAETCAFMSVISLAARFFPLISFYLRSIFTTR